MVEIQMPQPTAPASGDSPNPSPDRRYKVFWDDMGDKFPDLGQARSTADYRLDEERLFRSHLAPLEGIRIFKTDLWDEVKNTRILRWAAGEGLSDPLLQLLLHSRGRTGQILVLVRGKILGDG